MSTTDPAAEPEVDPFANLTPTQDLIIDLLVARHRLGEMSWLLSTKLSKAVNELVELELVRSDSGDQPYSLRVALTWPAARLLKLQQPDSSPLDTEPVRNRDEREYIPPVSRLYADRIAAYLKRVGAEKMAYQAVSRLFGTGRDR